MSSPQKPASREGGFREAFARLAKARKDDGTGGAPYSRFVNRPIGRVFATLAYLAHMTPDMVSLLSACFTVAGLLLLAAGPAQVLTGVGVTLLLVVGYALDSADGQLARLRGGGSPRGEWLDHVLDSAKLAALHLCVLIVWYRHFDLPTGLLLVPIGFSIVQNVGFSSLLLTELMLRVQHATRYGAQKFVPPPRAGARHPFLVTVARLPLDYGVCCLVFLTLGWREVFVGLYCFMAAANALFLALALRRYFRRLGAPVEPVTSASGT